MDVTLIRTLGALALTLFLPSARETAAQAPPPAFIGAWRPVAPPSAVPQACQGAFVEFKDDGTFVSHSGELWLTADYSATPTGGGFLVVEHNLRSNGQPNCQGIPARYFVDHFVHRAYFEIRGDTIHKYADESRAHEYFMMVRLPRPAGAASLDSTHK